MVGDVGAGDVGGEAAGVGALAEDEEGEVEGDLAAAGEGFALEAGDGFL